MKIQVENLGPLKQAEFEVADFTIICGSNNTGKTYATYSLFGFLQGWWKLVEIDIASEMIESLFTDGSISIDLAPYLGKTQEIVDTVCKGFSKQLSVVFDAPALQNAFFRVIVDAKNLDHLKESTYRWVISSQVNIFSIEKEKGDTHLDVTLLFAQGVRLPSKDSIVSSILSAIRDMLFLDIIPSVFIASVERTGISVFRHELDTARNILLEKMSRAMNNEDKLSMFEERYQEYSWPIQFGLDFDRSISEIHKGTSFISDKHPNILKDFADLVGGEYGLSDSNELYYAPRNSPRKYLSIRESSSSVRSLMSIGFYLRYIAKPGSLLIVDEPELNLHPENQRRIARLFARLVNIGIKVFITTHSDYIIKELNGSIPVM
jgi:hypothetical protein